jgi:hypothetical protein
MKPIEKTRAIFDAYSKETDELAPVLDIAPPDLRAVKKKGVQSALTAQWNEAASKLHFALAAKDVNTPTGQERVSALKSQLVELGGKIPQSSTAASKPGEVPTLSPSEVANLPPGTLYRGTDGKLRKR